MNSHSYFRKMPSRILSRELSSCCFSGAEFLLEVDTESTGVPDEESVAEDDVAAMATGLRTGDVVCRSS